MSEAATGEIFSPELLEAIRDRFLYVDWDPFTGERVYLEASGGSLRLSSVMETMAKESALPDELYRYNPASNYVVECVDKGTEDVRVFLGAKSGQIMPAQSATQTLFRAMNAITSHIPGTNVVTTELEHPAITSPAQYFADLHGMERRVARVSKDTSSVPLEAILDLIDKDTCVLAIQHASNQTGAVNDVKNIIEEARKMKPDLYVVIDAVQYAPHGPIDVEEIGADAYAFGPYKAYCVKGIGFAHISDRLAELPHWQLLGKPITNWVLGSPPHAMYAAWSAVVEYLCWLGSHFTDSNDRRAQVVAAKRAIHGHMTALRHRALYGSAETPGLLDLGHATPTEMDETGIERLCIFLFRVGEMDSSEAIGRYNREHHIRLAARIPDVYSKVPLSALGLPDAVRLSAAHYNTREEIDRFLRATAEIGGDS